MLKLFRRGHARTLALALFATATFVVAAIYMFDVPARLMLEFFLLSLLGLLVIIVSALLLTLVRMAVRRWLKR